jgi:hypothetical protein
MKSGTFSIYPMQAPPFRSNTILTGIRSRSRKNSPYKSVKPKYFLHKAAFTQKGETLRETNILYSELPLPNNFCTKQPEFPNPTQLDKL